HNSAFVVSTASVRFNAPKTPSVCRIPPRVFAQKSCTESAAKEYPPSESSCLPKSPRRKGSEGALCSGSSACSTRGKEREKKRKAQRTGAKGMRTKRDAQREIREGDRSIS